MIGTRLRDRLQPWRLNALGLVLMAAITALPVHAQDDPDPSADTATLAADAPAVAAVPTQAIAAPTAIKRPPIYTMPAKQVFGKMKGGTVDLPPRAIGGYAKGCLSGGKALSINGPAWQAMRLSRNRNWGHPGLVNLLERFATEMQQQDNWPGLLIGDMSQPRGGPMLTGHKSHQIGLDADLWYMPMPSKRLTRAERETQEPLKLADEKGTEVIAGAWNPGFVGLIRRASSYPEVERIFTHPAVKKALCDATSATDRGWLRKVRPMWSHNYHFHIRMHCPRDLPGCAPQKPTLDTDGCGKDLTDWLKRISAPPPKPKPRPPTPPGPPKPAKPRPKPKIMTLQDLPADCAPVALSGTDTAAAELAPTP